MLKRFVAIIFVLCLAPALFSFSEKPKVKMGIQTIIVDPGHGGIDIGARGAISTESKICLEIGLKLGKAIEEHFPWIKVLYTRTTDIIPGNKSNKNDGLRYRAEFANQSGADLFIAIHANAAPRLRTHVGYRYVGSGSKRRRIRTYKYSPNPATGTETYIWAADESNHKGDMVRTEDNFGENDSTIIMPEINDPVMKAYQLLYAKKFFDNSLLFAKLIETEFENQGRVSRGVKQRNDVGIWVLHATGMPSVLVETGFITDREEEKYLNSDKGQDDIVKNIIDALKNYNGHMERLPASNGNGNNSPDTKSAISSPAAINNNKGGLSPGR